MAKTIKTEITETLQIRLLDKQTTDYCIKGTSPFIFNAMSEKSKWELLMPKGRLSTAQKVSNLKHDPMVEYCNSMYVTDAEDNLTRLVFPAVAFKGAATEAAVRCPGIHKTEIKQLLWAEGSTVDLYGVPQLLMSVVRSADMNRTPDIRTRAILPRWACRIRMSFIRPHLTMNSVGTLLANAGMIIGVGDFRQEKGKGNFGQFEVCQADDPEYVAITKMATREAQDAAIANPATYDKESERLLYWFFEEAGKREKTVTKTEAVSGKKSKS